MIAEFATDVEGTIARLDYLKDLGINCVELMPVTNVALDVDWGYDPIGYFGLDERFGTQDALKRLVDEAHQRGIAVIVDAVYGHSAPEFVYAYLYEKLGLPSPTRGAYGPPLDYTRSLAQDLVLTANFYWLDRFHVDGFRYDELSSPSYWDGPVGVGFANLAYQTHQEVKARIAAPIQSYWVRFDHPSGPTLIQVAEYLASPDVLQNSYATSIWQNRTLDAARSVAGGEPGAIERLGDAFAAIGFPAVHASGPDTILQAPMQYIENHDHERLLCWFGRDQAKDPCSKGDRAHWPKLRPYLIGLLTSKGIPMLWEGQELGESYFVPNGDPCRVGFRPVRWRFFYDEPGRALRDLVRRLTSIRAGGDQFQTGDCWFHRDPRWSSRGLLLFSRYTAGRCSLVALNFTDALVSTEFWFTVPGNYREELWGTQELANVAPGTPTRIVVPGNCGCVWTTP